MISTELPVRDYVRQFPIRSDDYKRNTIVWSADVDMVAADEHDMTRMVKNS